ncbi:hypothetical protein Syun_008986 [Stephania yunnanensis]|uniref:Retrotransposon gag domain-containing protein n=1 Tax=Stephania yunnanensis TaxID=152371 RepID=A0AAP0KG53_9MAGN
MHFNLKYFPHTILREKRNDFMTLRQLPDESIMHYMGRYLQLLTYAGGVVDTDVDQTCYFMKACY